MLHRFEDAVWDAAIFIASMILAGMFTWWIWMIVKGVLSLICIGCLLLIFMSMI